MTNNIGAANLPHQNQVFRLVDAAWKNNGKPHLNHGSSREKKL